MPWHIAVTDACPIATPYGLLEDGTDKLVGCYENAEMAGEEMDDLLEAEAMIGAVPTDQPMRSIPKSGLIERRDAMTAWPEQEFELRSESNGMLFTGYAAIFDSPSEDLGGFRETIKPGAFKRSISHASGGKRDIKMFLNHNADVVLASTRASTLRLKEDAKGLVAEAQLPNSPWGESVAEAVRRGDISSMSFGFVIDKRGVHDSWSPDRSQRTLHEVRLLEVSPVTGWPAYSATSASIRSLIDAIDWHDDDTAQRIIDSLTNEQRGIMLRLLNRQAPIPYIAPDIADAYKRLEALKAKR